MRPNTVRIILTGYTDVNALVEAINSSVVYKYVTKPWINEDLRQTVKRAVQHYETIKAQHQLQLQHERLERRQQQTFDNFVKIIVRLLDIKEPGLQNHVRQTAKSAVAIGQKLNLPLEELKQISVAALLHEFAHVSVPHQVIHKIAELNEQQRQLLTKNFERELKMLASVPDLEDAASVIHAIDEQFDGNGFPDALDGERIPLHARIIAVADAYDEMTLRSNSNPNLTHDEALTLLQSFAGKRFDPEIVKTFCELKTIRSPGETEIHREMSVAE
jgi:response regulator RpfG family c-di-GMP phosphodiesterase